jgi:hypothetical protein
MREPYLAISTRLVILFPLINSSAGLLATCLRVMGMIPWINVFKVKPIYYDAASGLI